MSNQHAVSATNRFGLGARPGEIAALDDPQDWLLAQLHTRSMPAQLAGLPTSLDYLQQDIALQQARKEARRTGGEKPVDLAKDLHKRQARELQLRYRVAVASQASFVERMVRFWSNHFAVSVDKRVAAPYAAPMEREAIRPHVTGHFGDLLLAVETHPGMLRFLDNAQSVGQDSPQAMRVRKRNPDKQPGLNENLAREILELHTLGANGGYTQADVTELAKAITGWGVPMPQDFKRGDVGSAFVFRPNAHERGVRMVMGKRYAEDDLAQGQAVLADLAVHPATVRHVSWKIARHLVSDEPPPAVVDAMAKAWLKSDGDLTAVYTALIGHRAAWGVQARKFKTPDDYLVSALRAGAALGDQRPQALATLLNRMGQPTFTPRSPAGFEDDAAQWSGADALWKRVQSAQALAEAVPEDRLDPLATAQAVFADTLDADTLTALRRANRRAMGWPCCSPAPPSSGGIEMQLTRRAFLGAAGAMTTLTLWPSLCLAAPSANDTRLLVVLLRGGLDGLHTLIPTDDPDYRSLRGELAPADALALDGQFGLHPSLAFAHQLYGNQQLLPVVAIAPPYQQRSHFEAQDCLENGSARPSGTNTGWLNRCAAAMTGTEALSISTVMPLIMRGPGEASTWSPPLPEQVNPILLQRLQGLYAHDSALAENFQRAVATQGISGMGGGGGKGRMAAATAAAARFMSQADGPRIGFVEDSGWDTHAGQAAVLKNKLGELDDGLRAFHDGAATLWDKTVVVVVTEFGRTAKVNGTGGTDHGTGGLALLAGGAVRGGRIAGHWPGLAQTALNEGRDLRVTTDLRALFKAVLAGHLGVDEAKLEHSVFPDSRKVRAMDGLLV